MGKHTVKLGIGFATGRKAFRKVMYSYIHGWNEFNKNNCTDMDVTLSLFAAYDLTYSDTKSTDYTNLDQEIVDSFEEIVFINEKESQNMAAEYLSEEGVSAEDIKLVFSAGYAGKRNAVVYSAIKHKMDYLLFLDDDEYPVAVTNNRGRCLWGGQYIIPIHLEAIKNADISNGRHCGFISPIPRIEYNSRLTENDFHKFIDAISNDIIEWDSIQNIMKNRGVTYADTSVLTSADVVEVTERNQCKFITGSNLCINLTDHSRILPFYNPPGARGEDTFLSTLLTGHKVVKVPSYTFHDGFGKFRHLLDGALPIRLDLADMDSRTVVKRFFNACIGWVRYKPLLIHINDAEGFAAKCEEIRKNLEEVLPKICEYFSDDKFMRLLSEFNKYSKNAARHYEKFVNVQNAWKRLMKCMK